jgi:hypothetical protein
LWPTTGRNRTTNIHTDDDDHARRLVREKWTGEDDLLLVRQGGRRLVTMRRS